MFLKIKVCDFCSCRIDDNLYKIVDGRDQVDVAFTLSWKTKIIEEEVNRGAHVCEDCLKKILNGEELRLKCIE